MIKVLVVDDDKLVRKGLISAMPWQEFDMQVVGEASNGEMALEFLKSNAVDLLLTDIAMPVMTGMELMRIVRKTYPALHVVVLTLHRDFEHVQEALRLGAIDYIAKVQLERERFEEVLGRIAARIQEQTKSLAPIAFNDHTPIDCNDGYILFSLDRSAARNWAEELDFPEHEKMMELDNNCWIWFPAEAGGGELLQQLKLLLPALPESMLILLTDVKELTCKEIGRWLREYIDKVCFYEYVPHSNVISESIRREFGAQQQGNEERLDMLKNKWLSPNWLHNDQLFVQNLEELKQFRMAQVNLLGFLYAIVNDWNRLFSPNRLGKIQLRQTFHSWLQIEQWFYEIRDLIVQSTEKTNFSQEIVDCIMKAIQIMQAEMNQQLTAVEVAQRLNMSRSYFNQCFKEIVGHTFNEYLRKIRMEKAKEYLLYTNRTILWVAENTGYMDEKYFSRIFRAQTGQLPSEFRSYHRHNPEVGR